MATWTSPADDAATPLRAEPQPAGRDWLAEARRAFVAGDAQRALYAAREAISVNGAEAEAWDIRARCSIALGNLDDADFEARETVRFQPQVAEGHAILADVLMRKARYGEAERAIGEALQLEPAHLEYRVLLGTIHLNADRPTKAIPIFEEATKRDPDTVAYRHLLANALYDQAEGQTTQLPGDRHAITSPEQISAVRRDTSRALRLSITDSELRDALRALASEADRAEKRSWRGTEHPVAYFVTFMIALVVAIAGLGSVQTIGFSAIAAIACAALVWLFVRRHRRPNWAWNAAGAAQVVRHG